MNINFLHLKISNDVMNLVVFGRKTIWLKFTLRNSSNKHWVLKDEKFRNQWLEGTQKSTLNDDKGCLSPFYPFNMFIWPKLFLKY